MTESDERPGIVVPDPAYGVLTPVTVPGAAGAVGVAAGVATANPVALVVGGVLVVAGILGGGSYVVRRVLTDWPRSVRSRQAAMRILVENRPSRSDLERGLRATLTGTVLFAAGLGPLLVVDWAADRGSFGLGLHSGVVWVLAVVLVGGSVLASFVGARVVGRGLDRLVVAAAREWAFRRGVDRNRTDRGGENNRPAAPPSDHRPQSRDGTGSGAESKTSPHREAR